MSTILGHSYTSQNCTNACHEHAKCEVRNGVKGCYCSPGFTGPGITGPDKPGCYGRPTPTSVCSIRITITLYLSLKYCFYVLFCIDIPACRHVMGRKELLHHVP